MFSHSLQASQCHCIRAKSRADFPFAEQPAVASLFSSTSSHPLLLSSAVTASKSLTDDSFISLVQDADDSDEQVVCWHGSSASSRVMKGKGKQVDRGNIRSRVLHLQSPDVRSTSVRFGSADTSAQGSKALGLSLPFLHLAIKDLEQAWYFDVGVMDSKGRTAVIRVSTFQVRANLRLPILHIISLTSPPLSITTSHQAEPKFHHSTLTRPALLHLPLQFPPSSAHRLTHWSTLTLQLPRLLSSIAELGGPHFAPFASITMVEVHANCRLRRIWCSEDGKEVQDGMVLRGMMTELALFEAE